MLPAAPLVSILIRSSNRETLARALDSAAAQSWLNIEIVVVSASGAEHAALPAEWKGRTLRFLPAAGRLSRPVAANVLLANAQGDYLNFLDDDDELAPHHVETVITALMAQPEMRLAYSICRVFDDAGNDVGRLGRPGHHLLMFHQNRFAIHAALFSRKLVEQGLRFDVSFDRLEDLDFFVACGTRTEFLFVPDVTCTWHAFSGSSGMGYAGNANRSEQERATIRIREKWRKHFERWGRDPEGVLAVAESAMKFGKHQQAAQLAARLNSHVWPKPDLAQRYHALTSAIRSIAAGAASPPQA